LQTAYQSKWDDANNICGIDCPSYNAQIDNTDATNCLCTGLKVTWDRTNNVCKTTAILLFLDDKNLRVSDLNDPIHSFYLSKNNIMMILLLLKSNFISILDV
jgi:hypothetical protein